MIVVVDEGKWVMRVVVMVVPKIYIAIEILQMICSILNNQSFEALSWFE